MNGIENKKWDFSKEEKYAVDWFEKHGFEITLDAQYVSKTKFTIKKDGVVDHFELQQGLKKMDIASYMNLYERQFDILKQLTKKG